MDQIRNRMPNPISAILYLRRNCLEIYPGEGDVQTTLEYPGSAYKNLEITDKARIEEVFGTFLLKHPIKFRQFIIVLSDEILHRRTTPLLSPELEKKAADDFYGQIPFNMEKMARKDIRTDAGINFYVVNKELFLTIKNIIDQNGGEVLAVVPASIFGFTDPNIVFTSDILQIFKENEELLKTADFLTGLNKYKSGWERTKASSNKPVNNLNRAKILMLWLIIAVALITAFILSIWLLRGKTSTPSETLNPEVSSPAATVSATPSTAPSAKPRESTAESVKANYLPGLSLKISVLNGGGVAGLAGKVGDLFKKAGYVEVTIGNKANYLNEETEVTFSTRVSPDDRRQILQILSGLVKTTAVIEPPTEPPFDISIILGKGL